MNNISPQKYNSVKKKLYRDVKKQTEATFRKSDVKQKASALNMALPQYARYLILANIFKVENANSLEFDQLKSSVRNIIIMGGAITKLTTSIVLTIIDEVQYNLLRAVMSKTVPAMLSAQIVKLVVNFGSYIGMKDLTEDQVLEGFYLSNITNVKNFKIYKYSVNTFNEMPIQDKLKHVSEVVSHGAAMAYSYEASSTVANNLGTLTSLNMIRNIVLLVKYQSYISRANAAGIVNEIQGSKFLNLLTTKLKDSLMNFLTKIKLDKLKYVLRFVLESILGPLVLSYVNRGASNIAKGISKSSGIKKIFSAG